MIFGCFAFGNANHFYCNKSLENNYDHQIKIIIDSMIFEIVNIKNANISKYNAIHDKLSEIQKKLSANLELETKVNLLVSKDLLQNELQYLINFESSEISKIRYIKGLEIIKILYEKILGLDHHFASVRTFSEISKIANPNQYPEFTQVNELIKAKKDKKTGFDLTSILGTNTVVSVVNTFTNMLSSNLTKDEKQIEIAKIECILDFTLRMQNDLNTIYFETAYLQSSNEHVKNDLETLFKDYTKPISYLVPIKETRLNDDWEDIKQKLDLYILNMSKANESQKAKMLVNLEFPIDRLIQFITQYNNFINEGEKFYQKFNIILNSYENEKQCESKLPIEFKKLKSDITVAIDKFNVAYRPVEINGTKMKEILYGINDYK